MKTKLRTVPQFELSGSLGDCTPLFVSRETLAFIDTIMAITEFPATFLLQGKTYSELRQTGQFELAGELLSAKDEVITDYYRGRNMACDITLSLEGILQGILALERATAANTSAILSASCCSPALLPAGLQDGNIINPPTLDEAELCSFINYIRWKLDEFFASIYPIAVDSLQKIFLALSTSLFVPPYSTTVLEFAGWVVTGVTLIGSAGLFQDTITEYIDDVVDNAYCILLDIVGAVGDVVANIIASMLEIIPEGWARDMFSWTFGALGIRALLVEYLNGIVPRVPPGFATDNCNCLEASLAGWRMLGYCDGEDVFLPPTRVSADTIKFSAILYPDLVCGTSDNGYHYIHVTNISLVSEPVRVFSNVSSLSEGWRLFSNVRFQEPLATYSPPPTLDYTGIVNSIDARSVQGTGTFDLYISVVA
jgi:hypothetical protein